jgi:hypothetical protein
MATIVDSNVQRWVSTEERFGPVVDAVVVKE